VTGGPLAQRPAHEPARVASGTLGVAREQPRFDLGGQRSQAQEVVLSMRASDRPERVCIYPGFTPIR